MARIDWTARVDEALGRWQAMTAREAGERSGISYQIIARWRRLRTRGEAIQEVRGRNAEALLRFLDRGFDAGRIPLAAPAAFRRRPPRPHPRSRAQGSDPVPESRP